MKWIREYEMNLLVAETVDRKSLFNPMNYSKNNGK